MSRLTRILQLSILATLALLMQAAPLLSAAPLAHAQGILSAGGTTCDTTTLQATGSTFDPNMLSAAGCPLPAPSDKTPGLVDYLILLKSYVQNHGCILADGSSYGNYKVPDTQGILISHAVYMGGFRCYAYTFITENMPYVMIIAIVLIVFSGVQYMGSMGNAATQTKAKERILGVLGGLVFYFLIIYILQLMAKGLVF